MRIDIVKLQKSFDDTVVLDGIDLEIRAGEFLGLLGPSGSGKTTLLRILAGLEAPDLGRVLIDDKDLLAMNVQERQVGLVFQHYALFNHMTVFDNVAFGLQVRPHKQRPSKAQIHKRVKELLGLVQLQGMDQRFPGRLSGGQKQRVALARALSIQPKILLLDEPFGALDAKVRVELRRWLRDLHDAMGLTTVFVTHDQDEALDLADRIAIMNRGRIEQLGTPAEIYEQPATPFVYDFLGAANAFKCEVKKGMARIGDKTLPVEPDVPDGPAVAFVRPHDTLLADPDVKEASDDATLPGVAVVRHLTILGPHASVELMLDKQLIEADVARSRVDELKLQVGSKCAVRARTPRIFAKTEVAALQSQAKKAEKQRLRFLRRA